MTRQALGRKFMLGLALLAAIAASVWPGPREPQLTAVVAPAASQGMAQRREGPLVAQPELPPLDNLRVREQQRPRVEDLFSPESWTPPPPPPPPRQAQPPAPEAPPVAAAPPPAPAAPEFPYTVAGSIADAEGVMVVFSNTDQNFVLRAGEVLGRDYRVDRIESESVTLTYLPLGLAQRVPLPGAQ